MGKKISAKWIEGTESNQLDAKAIGRGFVRSLLISFLGIGVLALIIFFSQASNIYLAEYFNLIFIVSALLGGIKAGISIGKNGWLHGLVVAISYAMLLVLVSLGFLPKGYNLGELIIQIAGLGLIGALGGIFGVNLRDHQRRQELRNHRLIEKYWSHYKKNR